MLLWAVVACWTIVVSAWVFHRVGLLSGGRMFHSHQWKTLSRKHSPRSASRIRLGEVSGVTAEEYRDLIDRSMHGITTINQECEGCGIGRAYTVAGDAT